MKNVEEIYGIEFEAKSQIHAKEILWYVSEKLKRMPCLLVEMDVFYCPWMTDYHIRHNRHTFIVLKVRGEALVCIDPVLGKTEIMLSFEEIEQGFLRVIEPKRCKVAEKNKMTYENKKRWDKKIEKALKRNINIRDMYLFYEELSSCSFETEFGTETNIWYIPLFTELSKIYSGHVRFAQFLLEYFQTTKREDGLRVANEWENIGSHWHMLYLWVMKIHKE